MLFYLGQCVTSRCLSVCWIWALSILEFTKLHRHRMHISAYEIPSLPTPLWQMNRKKKTHANTTKRTPCEACVGQGNELDVLKIMCHLPLRRTLLPCTVPRPLSVTCDLHPMLKYVDGNWLCITKTRQTVFLVIVEFCVGGKSITASGKPWNRLHLHA